MPYREVNPQKKPPPADLCTLPPTPLAEFLDAVESYRNRQRRPLLTWCEVLEIARGLGFGESNSPA
jgi:hypothetical protein